jgi:hypothetical protein
MAELPEHRACRNLAADEGRTLRGRILDGPSAGHETRSFALGSWSPHVCCRTGLGPWHHHVHDGAGVYRYVGLCDDHHPVGDHPDTFGPMCPAVDNRVDEDGRIET